jgi:hypothetical protein
LLCIFHLRWRGGFCFLSLHSVSILAFDLQST